MTIITQLFELYFYSTIEELWLSNSIICIIVFPLHYFHYDNYGDKNNCYNTYNLHHSNIFYIHPLHIKMVYGYRYGL
jgi:hypothetical protein